MNPGERVRTKDGCTYVILKVTEMHYGLVDPTRPPMVDAKNGQQVAHIAVRHEEVDPYPVQGVAG